MRQVHQQIAQQKLALSQGMRTSLSLLHMTPGDVAEQLAAERRRNPFLRVRASSPLRPSLPDAELVQLEDAAQSLLQQIGLIRFDGGEAHLARDLVHCLDERGFLVETEAVLCGELGVDTATLRSTIARLHASVEPIGTFARSLTECFRLQLLEKNRFDPVIAVLLERLDLVAQRDFDAICALCGVDREDAEEMVEDIRELNPAPLAMIGAPADPVICPDLEMDHDAQGRLAVRLCPDAIPDVLADDAMFSRLQRVETEGAAWAYYKDCYGAAAGFVIALQKRANTMLRIGQHLARVQVRFLTTGRLADLVPLTMEGAAKVLGLHKSTISRAMAGCTVQTPHGVLPADTFFVRGFSQHAAHRTRAQVLRRLGLLIQTEDKARPLSDQALCMLMCRANFAMSRRTVAKHRALLGQPVAAKRRVRAIGPGVIPTLVR